MSFRKLGKRRLREALQPATEMPPRARISSMFRSRGFDLWVLCAGFGPTVSVSPALFWAAADSLGFLIKFVVFEQN